MMTGESVPAEAVEGDKVTGGTIALTGRLVVRGDRVGPDTQLAQMIAWSSGPGRQGRLQRLADRICGVFVPVVLPGGAHAGRLAAGRRPGRARRSARHWRC